MERADLARVYCGGDLLREVQLAALFEDSKHFVDMPVRRSSGPRELLAAFERLQQRRGALSAAQWREQLLAFVGEHFDEPGAELLPMAPRDFQDEAEPPAIAGIQHPRLRDWALQVHGVWKRLGRVADDGVVGSFLLPKPVTEDEDSPLARPRGHAHNVLVVPGGRFRETYYWDSYWIVRGLLVSGLRETARGVVNNLLEYLAEFGFVPNGGRIYYLTRSQPPLLSDMVRLVAAVDGGADRDLDYIRAALPLLEREYAFWMKPNGESGSLIEVQPPVSSPNAETAYRLNRYVARAGAPRPESYSEDYLHARNTSVDGIIADDYETFYNEVIASAESGWDFSSRWFADGSSLRSISTSKVIPVELNAALFRFESNLAHFHSLLKNEEGAHQFSTAARRRQEAMNSVLWSNESGVWKDYWWQQRRHSTIVSVSDYSPLWARAYDPQGDATRVKQAIASLETSGLILLGGAQTTATVTGQQWDAPNAWPPEQDRLVEGLLSTELPEAKRLAKNLVEAWVATGYTAWTRTGQMFEKYNATELGGIGSGGEYVPQLGFGWSNGVLLRFLTEYEQLMDVEKVFALVSNARNN